MINHREINFFFRYYLSSTGCLYLSIYVSIYVIAIVATPFNPQLRNFNTTFLIWLSKNVFLKFLEIVFYRVYALFYISLRFICNWRGIMQKPMEIGLNFFAHKLAGTRQKFVVNFFAQKCPHFVWLFVFQIVSLV